MAEKLLAKAFVEKSEDEEGVLQAAVASTGVVDREGEVIDPEGWDIEDYKKNPVLLWRHNALGAESSLPIGKVTRIWREGKKLMFRPKFDMGDEFAAKVYRKFKEGFLNAFSVGFLPLEKNDNTYTNQQLLEVSAVPVPANPEALVQQRAIKELGAKPMEWEELMNLEEEKDEEPENKEVISYEETSTAPKGRSWDASAATQRIKEWAEDEDGEIDFSKYRRAFTWVDSENSELQGSYKLPHHDVSGGELVVVWRGVAAGMAALLGARGGVDIPDSDRRGVYNHLKKHYAQFDEEAPDFRMVQDQVGKQVDSTLEVTLQDEDLQYINDRIGNLEGKLKRLEQDEKRPPEVTTKDGDIDWDAVFNGVKIINQVTASVLEKRNETRGGEKEK